MVYLKYPYKKQKEKKQLMKITDQAIKSSKIKCVYAIVSLLMSIIIGALGIMLIIMQAGTPNIVLGVISLIIFLALSFFSCSIFLQSLVYENKTFKYTVFFLVKELKLTHYMKGFVEEKATSLGTFLHFYITDLNNKVVLSYDFNYDKDDNRSLSETYRKWFVPLKNDGLYIHFTDNLSLKLNLASGSEETFAENIQQTESVKENPDIKNEAKRIRKKKYRLFISVLIISELIYLTIGILIFALMKTGQIPYAENDWVIYLVLGVGMVLSPIGIIIIIRATKKRSDESIVNEYHHYNDGIK
ncbi:MAG: hypothetical protein WCR67_02750 [Bacilli bacterium]